ncbi:MAG: hypothetical protein JSV80_13365 [Acidobacteriota bacterium]|nr:MAG: hypothetical protein JSV80_13365 [Acidobacteriota bacterium]
MADRLPVLRLESANADFPREALEANAAKSADADAQAPDLDLLATGLMRQGSSKQRSRELVQRACESLAPALRTEEAILRQVLSL